MAVVNFYRTAPKSDGGFAPAAGFIKFTQTGRRRIAGSPDNTVLDLPFSVTFVNGLVAPDLAATGVDWVWLVEEHVKGLPVRSYAVTVPSGAGPFDDGDLTVVDPRDYTPVPGATSVAGATDAAVAGFVNNTASETRTALNAAFAQVITPEKFGAKGDGTTDDTAAVQAAFNAVPASGGWVLFARVYRITSGVTVPNRTKITGLGAFDPQFNLTSGLVCGVNAIDALTINKDSCVLEDFGVKYDGGTRPTSGTGIRFARGDFSRVNRIGVTRFWTNLRYDTGFYYTISDSNFYDPANYGIHLTNTDPTGGDHGDQGIINCVISKVADTVRGGSAVRWESGGGLRFTGNKINAGAQVGYGATEKWDYGLDIMAEDGVSTGIFPITGNTIENAHVALLRIGQKGPANTGDLLALTITGNEFGVGWSTCDGIVLGAAAPAATGHIRTVHIADNIFQNLPGRGIVADNMVGLTIGANTFEKVAGVQVALGSDHRSTNVDAGALNVRDAPATVLIDGINSSHGGPFSRIVHNYGREINVNSGTVYQGLWEVGVPSYCGGSFELVLEGSIASLGSFLVKRRRTFTHDLGVLATTADGTDVASGYAGDLDVQIDTSVADKITFNIKRTSVSTGGVVIGRAYLRYDGPASSVKLL